MTFYLYKLFNKIYKFFEIKVFEHKYIQTDSRLTTDNKSLQTDPINNKIMIDKAIQTNLELLNNQDDNEWDNLTWVNANTVDIV